MPEEMEIPKLLIPLRQQEDAKALEPRLSSGQAIFIIQGGVGFDGDLSIFGTPTRVIVDSNSLYKDSFEICPRGNIKLRWYIRRSRERGDNLWDSFSEELVMLRLTNLSGVEYEIKCSQARAILSMGAPYGSSYLFNIKRRKGKEEVFNFGAREMIRSGRCGEFSDAEIEKLSEFLYEDFRTQKYARKSARIGLETDSVFFP